jgi:hypothetical protein
MGISTRERMRERMRESKSIRESAGMSKSTSTKNQERPYDINNYLKCHNLPTRYVHAAKLPPTPSLPLLKNSQTNLLPSQPIPTFPFFPTYLPTVSAHHARDSYRLEGEVKWVVNSVSLLDGNERERRRKVHIQIGGDFL